MTVAAKSRVAVTAAGGLAAAKAAATAGAASLVAAPGGRAGGDSARARQGRAATVAERYRRAQ